MSDRKNDENRKPKKVETRRTERSERDSSPSGYSHSSYSAVLEWDPSADVGSTYRPPSVLHTGTSEESNGISILERIAIDMTAGYTQRPPSSRASLLGRSRSVEEPPPDDDIQSSHSIRSFSMIELGTLGIPKKDRSNPVPLAVRDVQSQQRNVVSPIGSVATVVSHNKNGTIRKEDSRNRGFEPQVDVSETPPRSPQYRRSTTTVRHVPPATSTSSSRRQPSSPPSTSTSGNPRPRQSHASRYHESDANMEHESSDDVRASQKVIQVNRRKVARGVSEASTDWEYGHSRSHSHDKDVSSLSEWQSSGVTKSELKYQSQSRPDDSASTGTGSFSLQVNINKERDNLNDQAGSRPKAQYRKSSLDDNIGYVAVGSTALPSELAIDRQYRRSSLEDENIGYINVQQNPDLHTKPDERASHLSQHRRSFNRQYRRSSLEDENIGYVDAEDRQVLTKKRVDHDVDLQYRRSSLEDEAVGYIDIQGDSPKSLMSDRDIGRRTGRALITPKVSPHKVGRHLRSSSKISRASRAAPSSVNRKLSSPPLENKENVPRHTRRHSQDERRSTRQRDINSSDEVGTLRTGNVDLRGNLSSTCLLLLNLTDRRGPLTESQRKDTLMTHRETHIKRFRKELDHIHALNRILGLKERKRRTQDARSKMTKPRRSSTDDSNHLNGKDKHRHVPEPQPHYSGNRPSYDTTGMGTKKHDGRHHTTHAKEKVLTAKDLEKLASLLHTRKNDHYRHKTDDRKRTSEPVIRTSSSISTVSSRPSITQHCHHRGHSTRSSNFSSRGPDSPRDSLSYLVDKLNILTDLFVLGQKVPALRDDSSETSETSKLEERSPKKTSPKRSITFFVPFPGCKCPTLSSKDMEAVKSGTTLREVYERVNPNAVTNMKKREEILALMKEEREKRGEIKREWLRTHPDLTGLSQALPPKGPRVMSAREMKELTRRKYKKLAEVQLQIYQRDLNEQRRVNRFMKDNYSHELKKNTLSGHSDIGHSRSIIRG